MSAGRPVATISEHAGIAELAGRHSGSWLDDPDAVRPVVLVIGGFLASPPVYRRLAARLRRRGAVDVVVAPIWTPDWILVTVRGMGPVVTRAGRALLRAGELAASSDASGGAPLLVVGHSAGGVTARLLTSPEPFEGRMLRAAGRIGAIVTLGSPHHVAVDGDIGSQIGTAASAYADRVVPGATFAPYVGYVSVSTRGVVGRIDGDGRGRTAHRFYRGLLGEAAVGRPEIEGDGLVPVGSALLEGATQIVLDDTTHGPSFGAPWYCSDERIDLWWPAALDAWHGALRARARARQGREPVGHRGI